MPQFRRSLPARLAGVLALVATLAVAACSGQTPADPPRVRLRFASGTPRAGFSPFGDGLARELERVLPSLEVEVHESDSAASNVEAIQGGTADIGLSHADVAYLAYVGRLEGRGERFTRLRGIAMLQLTRVHIVVRGNSGIRRLEDLRGRRISLGRQGRGASSTGSMILAAVGLGAQDVSIEPLRHDEAATRLTAGTLDAFVVNGSFPLDVVAAATRGGARLLPVEGPAVDRLRQAYPFFSRTTIPGGVYPGHPTAIHTIGVDTLLVCRSDLSEPLVHDLTQRLFEILPLLSSPQLSLSLMELERAPTTPIPLHDGAARYYRERELAR